MLNPAEAPDALDGSAIRTDSYVVSETSRILSGTGQALASRQQGAAASPAVVLNPADHCAGKVTHTHTGANKAKLEHYVRQHIPEAKRPQELFSGPQQTPTGGWK